MPLSLSHHRQTTAQASDSSLPPKPSGSGYRRQTSHPSGAKRIKKISRLHSVDPKDIPKDPGIIDLTKDGDDFTLVPTSLWFGKKSKRIPSPNLGFLIQVRAMLYDQILNTAEKWAKNFTVVDVTKDNTSITHVEFSMYSWFCNGQIWERYYMLFR